MAQQQPTEEWKVKNDEVIEEKDASRVGGYHFTDQEYLKFERQIIWDFIKKIGANILEGKDLVNVAIPVEIFEPRSFLERLSDVWGYAPALLTKAAKERDPVERLKLVMAFAIGGLHNTVKYLKKPFNPIIGETYQASYPDGTQIYCEQTSHHPPVSHFHVVPPDYSYQVRGYGAWSANFRGNAIKGQQSGPEIIDFVDGSSIQFEPPYMYLRGMLMGEKVFDYCGHMVFRDDKNHLVCDIEFNPDQPSYFSSWFVSAKTPSDWFRGKIMRYDSDVCTAEGSWLSHIAFDGELFFNFKTEVPAVPVPDPNPLPSDCRFRSDLIALQSGNLPEAGRQKVILEEAQRYDARLRKNFQEAEEKALKL